MDIQPDFQWIRLQDQKRQKIEYREFPGTQNLITILSKGPFPAPSPRSGCVIITGFSGALAKRAVPVLASMGYSHFIGVSRSPQIGSADIQVISGDISEESFCRSVINFARERNLKGIIHAAGLLDDRMIHNQTKVALFTYF